MTIPENSEKGTWTVSYLLCTDAIQNEKRYKYSSDYIAGFMITSPTILVGNIWSSDSMGNAKDSSVPGESVYVTVPEFGQPVSLYVVADKSAWNDGDSLADVSLDGVETLTLNTRLGTPTIQVGVPHSYLETTTL